MAQLLKWQPQNDRFLYPLKSPHIWSWDRGGLWSVAGVQQQPVGQLEPEKTSVEVAFGAEWQHPLSKAVEDNSSHTKMLDLGEGKVSLINSSETLILPFCVNLGEKKNSKKGFLFLISRHVEDWFYSFLDYSAKAEISRKQQFLLCLKSCLWHRQPTPFCDTTCWCGARAHWCYRML